MKTSISHLPLNKQQELERVTQLIVETADPEKVILYGSYATGEWQEDRYAEGNMVLGFDSDYDILVVTKAGDKRRDFEVTSQIKNRARYRVPINIITHDLDYINQQLLYGRYFFTEIIRQGILLHDRGVVFTEPKQLSKEERKEIAMEDFKNWFQSATDFLESCLTNSKEGRSKLAIFELHQATERFYDTVLLVFTGYKPKTHNLDKLRTQTRKFSSELDSIFPVNSTIEEYLFELLQKGYIDARYNNQFTISDEDLQVLMQRVILLQQVVRRICEIEIASIDK